MKLQGQPVMSPVDVVVLIKLLLSHSEKLSQLLIARDLFISQSEVSKSLRRSRYAGLVVGDYTLMRESLKEFLIYGLKYAFPQQPGPVVRGIPTAHSVPPLSDHIQIDSNFVWPSAKGYMRGQAIIPLYPSVVDAVRVNPELHEVLALIDVIRVGKNRERNLAIQFLETRI